MKENEENYLLTVYFVNFLSIKITGIRNKVFFLLCAQKGNSLEEKHLKPSFLYKDIRSQY